MTIPKVLKPLVEAGKDSLKDDVPQAAAALSFYAITALPPLAIILMSLLSLFYGQGAALDQLTGQVQQLLGPSAAELIEDFVSGRSQEGHGLAALGGTAILLVGASGFFAQLQKALNQVWEVRPKPSAGIKHTIVKRLLSMSAVLGTGFLLLASLVLTAAISAAGQWMEQSLGIQTNITMVGVNVVNLLVVAGLFALIFKYLPDVVIRWRDVWRGAFTTALFFLAGKLAIGWYLGRADFAADYGSAGTLVAVLFWIYFSSIILLFGAELTQVKARLKGREIHPEPYAERIQEQVVASREYKKTAA